jgi:hypothetical protein
MPPARRAIVFTADFGETFHLAVAAPLRALRRGRHQVSWGVKSGAGDVRFGQDEPAEIGGLMIRHKLRKMAVTRELWHAVTCPNQAWSMDFVADHMADGSKFRMLTISIFTPAKHWRSKSVSACAASMWWPH